MPNEVSVGFLHGVEYSLTLAESAQFADSQYLDFGWRSCPYPGSYPVDPTLLVFCKRERDFTRLNQSDTPPFLCLDDRAMYVIDTAAKTVAWRNAPNPRRAPNLVAFLQQTLSSWRYNNNGRGDDTVTCVVNAASFDENSRNQAILRDLLDTIQDVTTHPDHPIPDYVVITSHGPAVQPRH